MRGSIEKFSSRAQAVSEKLLSVLKYFKINLLYFFIYQFQFATILF